MTDPTPLATRIAREHRYIESFDECSCGDDVGPSHALHIATVTERAVRERIAAEIEAFEPEDLREAIYDAADIARGAPDA